MSNLAMRKALERISTYPRDRKDELSAASMRQIAREALDRPIDAVSESIEVPLGAIHNGRSFIERIQSYGFECQGGSLENCGDWQQLVSCFEHLSEWAESQDSAPAIPEGWMSDKNKVDHLVNYLESIAWQPDFEGNAVCVDQAAAMSADVIRKVLLPMLEATKEMQS